MSKPRSGDELAAFYCCRHPDRPAHPLGTHNADDSFCAECFEEEWNKGARWADEHWADRPWEQENQR